MPGIHSIGGVPIQRHHMARCHCGAVVLRLHLPDGPVDIAPRLGVLKAGGADRKRHDKCKSWGCKGHVIPTSDE